MRVLKIGVAWCRQSVMNTLTKIVENPSCSPILGHKKQKHDIRSSCWSAGLGRGLQTITASLDLLPHVTSRAFSEHNKKIAEDVDVQSAKKNHARSDFYEKPHDGGY